MLILSRVCAEFRDGNGHVIHRVTPVNKDSFHEAPESIVQDPLFQMLVNEGSLEANITPARKRALENNPSPEHDAAGRALKPATGGKEKTVKSAVKTDTKAAQPAGETAPAGSGT